MNTFFIISFEFWQILKQDIKLELFVAPICFDCLASFDHALHICLCQSLVTVLLKYSINKKNLNHRATLYYGDDRLLTQYSNDRMISRKIFLLIWYPLFCEI